jgi:hypothetical protein
MNNFDPGAKAAEETQEQAAATQATDEKAEGQEDVKDNGDLKE